MRAVSQIPDSIPDAEAHIQRAILAAWGAHPRLRIARINTGKAMIKGRMVKFGVPGTADIVGLIAPWGRMIQIEVKKSTGVQSPEQKIMERVVTTFGGVYCLARSVADVDQCMAALGITR